jgi:hypothetical protein
MHADRELGHPLFSWPTAGQLTPHSLFFTRSVLTNVTEAACLKNTADSGRKVFTNFKTSPLDAAGSLPAQKYADVFVSVTCVVQGQNTVLIARGAAINPRQSKPQSIT